MSRIFKAHKRKSKSVPKPGNQKQAKWNPGIGCSGIMCRGKEGM